MFDFQLEGALRFTLLYLGRAHFKSTLCSRTSRPVSGIDYLCYHTVDIIPNMDYKPSRRYSAKARQWLTCLENQHHSIRHAKMGVKSLKSPYGGRLRLGIAFCYVMSHYDCYRRDCPALSVIRI